MKVATPVSVGTTAGSGGHYVFVSGESDGRTLEFEHEPASCRASLRIATREGEPER